MPNGDDRGKGGGQGGDKWNKDQVDWIQGYSLYIKDPGLAKTVYAAIWTTKNFRLVFQNAVVCAIPKNNTEPCHGDGKPLFKLDDMEWDKEGCLRIKKKALGDLVTAAHAAGNLQIVVNKKDVVADDGTIGDQKVNAMCFC